jgi:hypothetical protein
MHFRHISGTRKRREVYAHNTDIHWYAQASRAPVSCFRFDESVVWALSGTVLVQFRCSSSSWSEKDHVLCSFSTLFA